MSNITTKKEKFTDLKRRLDEQKSQSVAPRAEFDAEMLEAIESVGEPTQRIDIMTIHPDLAQPRRAIPTIVHGGKWDGNPETAIDILKTWQLMAENAAGVVLDVVDMLNGRGDGIKTPEHPIAEQFINLVRLGASIRADKLINAITVSARHDAYLIETGERRWLAHHLLNYFIDESFGRIDAQIVEHDAFRQGSENNMREKLNAIGMARQIAVLVIAMYEGDRNVHFDSIQTLTFNGCDRRYYAQVRHGRTWKIKDGFAERVLAATGLPSLDRVSDYRALLCPSNEGDEEENDRIWLLADSENWTENAILEHVEGLKKAKSVGESSNTGNSPSPAKTTDTPTTEGKSSAVEFAIGQRVIIDGNPQFKGVVSRKAMGGYTVNLMAGGSRFFEGKRLTPVDKFSDSPAQPRGAATPTIKEESDTLDNETDYTTPSDGNYDDEWEDDDFDVDDEDDTPDYSPFDDVGHEVLENVANATDVLNIEASLMMEDLCLLDRKKLQSIVDTGGMEEVDRLITSYEQSLDAALEAIRVRGQFYIQQIRPVAQHMIED